MQGGNAALAVRPSGSSQPANTRKWGHGTPQNVRPALAGYYRTGPGGNRSKEAGGAAAAGIACLAGNSFGRNESSGEGDVAAAEIVPDAGRYGRRRDARELSRRSDDSAGRGRLHAVARLCQ